MTFRHRVLASGYFPAELPPPFNTEGFADFARKNPNYIVDLWSPFGRKKGYKTKLVRHHLAQAGKNRRMLSIPNPINQLRLVQALESSKARVLKAARASPVSGSKPVFRIRGPRAISPQKRFGDAVPEKRARVRETARYIAATDVARCFPSIYTHAIPWALHTKPRAKANHGPGLVGNLLDKIVRESQDEQTIGIPIGPDTSYLLSEVILSAVDCEACSRRHGFRWYDDYELSGTTRTECESALVKLERALLYFELEVNREKTAILELPLPIEEEWVQVLREFEFRRSGRGQFSELNSFFSRAFEFTEEAGKQSVLRYAVRKLNAADIGRDNWTHAQRLMAQAATQEPEVLPHVIGCLNFYEQRDYDLDKGLLRKVLGSICMEYADRFVASEVAWAIWGYLQFRLEIPKSCVLAARDLEDDVVSLLLLDARRKGLILERSALTGLRNYVKEDAFEGEHWLLYTTP